MGSRVKAIFELPFTETLVSVIGSDQGDATHDILKLTGSSRVLHVETR